MGFCEFGFRQYPANTPPKPLLTVLFRQPTANKKCGSFFGQNDSLVAVSANGFVVRQDSQEEVRNASRVDFVRVRECILHLCIRDGFCFWVCLLEVCQNLPEQQTLLIFGDVSRYDVTKRTFPDARLTSHDKEDGKLDMRLYIDSATAEVFAEHGSVYFLQPRRVQNEVVKELNLIVEGGTATIENLTAHELKSIWTKNQ